MNSTTTIQRAEQSRGISSDAIYSMVADAIRHRHSTRGVIVDVGCGTGNLWEYVNQQFDHYVGVDVYRFEGFPRDEKFVELDLDTGTVPVEYGFADVAVAVETIEHLENPRALFRELVRICKPGGWVIVTTPNQLSLLSKLTLLFGNQFNAFTDTSYPAHITALLEIDLKRIAMECGLGNIQMMYTLQGRIPGTSMHFPKLFSRFIPRAMSDNLLLAGRKG